MPVGDATVRGQGVPVIVISLVQRSVMVSGLVPGAMEVVGHHVDEVQVLGDLGHVVAVVDTKLGGRYGGGQQPFVRFESFVEFFNEICKVLLVIPTSITILSSWILPVKIKTIKVVLTQKIHNRLNKLTQHTTQ